MLIFSKSRTVHMRPESHTYGTTGSEIWPDPNPSPDPKLLPKTDPDPNPDPNPENYFKLGSIHSLCTTNQE